MLRKAIWVAVGLSLAGCPQGLTGGSVGGGGGTSAGGGAGGGSAAGGGAGGGSAGGGAGGGAATGGGGGSSFAASAKGLVRFKKNERLTADYAKSLGLPANQVCNELGLYSCANVVHHLPLGGVDPYNIGIYEPLPFTGLTSPIVTDRVALSACIQRVTADLATPATALIYKGIALDAMGKLDVAATPVKTAIDTLYKQVLLREPTAAEVGHLSQLYTDIAATGKPDPGKNWMTLSCFAVLTSVESVFY